MSNSTIIMEAGSRKQEAGSRKQEAGSRKQEAGSRKQEAGSRKHYFDFLRVAACFAVIVIHVAAQNWYTTDVNSFEWQVLNFYDSIARFGVPIFVMISGALFLSKDIPLRRIYSKYIFRIVTAFLFWSFAYAAMDYMKTGDILKASAQFIKGHYHMWFLFMIVGLYMIVPFMRKIAESESLTKYFLCLAVIFAYIIPEAVDIISVVSEKYSTFAGSVVNNFNMCFVMGFSGYFLLGHVLNTIELSPKVERAIYLAGILGAASTVLMSVFSSMIRNETFLLYDNHNNASLNVMCESAAIFVFFKRPFTREVRIIGRLSQYSFGAYLVHAAAINVIAKLGLDSLTFNPLFSVPAVSVMVFALSFGISAVLNHLLVLKKYIV